MAFKDPEYPTIYLEPGDEGYEEALVESNRRRRAVGGAHLGLALGGLGAAAAGDASTSINSGSSGDS